MDSFHEQNRRVWDERARRGAARAIPVTDQDLRHPLPIIDQCGWLGEVSGKKVLCLAAGGGKQSALFAAAGAEVTVVDLSPRMLELDRQAAREHGFKIAAIEASMDHLPMLPDGRFDLVIQPASTCYVGDVGPVYREVARVTVPQGLYISQHKQPACLQAGTSVTGGGYLLIEPVDRREPLIPALLDSPHREAGAIEFIHRWEDLIGAMCRHGFVIEDLVEPRHGDRAAAPGTFGHRSRFLPPFVTIKARRTDRPPEGKPPGLLLE